MSRTIFADDHILLTGGGHSGERICAHLLDLPWPPPETIEVYGKQWKRLRYSKITDEQRAKMEFVCRGAEYSPADPQP